jgi:rubrerythrin
VPSDSSPAATQQDGTIVIGVRCLDDDCDWGPLGTDDPSTWDIVEQFRLDHETEMGHQTTVETVRQRTILAGAFDHMAFSDYLIEHADEVIEWLCPECERTADELDASKRCPDCGKAFREVHP